MSLCGGLVRNASWVAIQVQELVHCWVVFHACTMESGGKLDDLAQFQKSWVPAGWVGGRTAPGHRNTAV